MMCAWNVLNSAKKIDEKNLMHIQDKTKPNQRRKSFFRQKYWKCCGKREENEWQFTKWTQKKKHSAAESLIWSDKPLPRFFHYNIHHIIANVELETLPDNNNLSLLWHFLRTKYLKIELQAKKCHSKVWTRNTTKQLPAEKALNSRL